MSGLVIVADNDPLDLQRRSAALEQAGRRVLCRGLGEPLISALRNQDVELIVIGFGDTDIDIGLCRAVRSHAEAPILVTGPEPTLEDVEGALGAGADDFLIAPTTAAFARRVLMWRQYELRQNLEERRTLARKRVEERKNGGGPVEDLAGMLDEALGFEALPEVEPLAGADVFLDEFIGDLGANGETLVAPKPKPKPAPAKKAKAVKKPKRKNDPTERVWG